MTTTKGKPTFYPGKLQKPVTTDLTDESRKEVERCKRALGVSRSDLLEHAWRHLRGLALNAELETQLAKVSLPGVLPDWFIEARADGTALRAQRAAAGSPDVQRTA